MSRLLPPPLVGAGDPRGFETLIARYLEAIGVKGFSERTILSAGYVLRLFAAWCGERGLVRPSEVTRGTIERYQRWLYHYRKPSGRPLGFATQGTRLVHVRNFFRFLAKQRYLLYNPASELELPKRPQRLPVDVLTREEVELVLAQVDLRESLGVRDRAILETFYSTGVRRSELIGLDLYDLDFERGWVTVRQGKGGKDRVVPIGDRALAWVTRYLDELRPQLVLRPDEWALFLSHRGERLSTGGLTNGVRRLIEKAGIGKRGSCHIFRHSCATHMLEGGADIRFIQQLLGHSNLETTDTYTRVSITKLKQIHSATHPAKLERVGEVQRDELLSSLAAELSDDESGDGNSRGDGDDAERC